MRKGLPRIAPEDPVPHQPGDRAASGELRLLGGEDSVARPDQEAQYQRQKRRDEADDRADHALQFNDIGGRQHRMRAEPGQRADKGRDRRNRGVIDENDGASRVVERRRMREGSQSW